MEDVVHILSLLKQQAEAQLAMKTNRKNDALMRIEMLEKNIILQGRSEAAQTNAVVYEHWRLAQAQIINQIKIALPILDQDILNSFNNLQTVQAKVTAAEGLAVKKRREDALKAEGIEEDAMLDLSLLRRKASLSN